MPEDEEGAENAEPHGQHHLHVRGRHLTALLQDHGQLLQRQLAHEELREAVSEGARPRIGALFALNVA